MLGGITVGYCGGWKNVAALEQRNGNEVKIAFRKFKVYEFTMIFWFNLPTLIVLLKVSLELLVSAMFFTTWRRFTI